MITRLYTVDQAYIDFDPTVPCLIAQVHGYMVSDEFRSYMMKGLELVRLKVKEHGKLAWIADLTKSDVFNFEDTEWAREYWHIEAHKAGLGCATFVTPESVFATASLNQFMEKTDKKLSISRDFYRLEDAKQ
jgi:hypothetical protein